MKIISVDNYDRELPGTSNDKLIASGLTEYWSNAISKLINDVQGCDTDRYYRSVPDDYILKTYEQ